MTTKLTVTLLPSEQLVRQGVVYLPANHPLLGQYVKIYDGNSKSVPRSGVYLTTTSEEVTGLALSKAQRNFLLLNAGDLAQLEKVDVNKLPAANIVLIVTKGQALIPLAKQQNLLNFTVMNLSETMTFNTSAGVLYAYSKCLDQPELSSVKASVRVASLTVVSSADAASTSEGSAAGSSSSSSSPYAVQPSPLSPTQKASTTPEGLLASVPVTINYHNNFSGVSFQAVDFEKLGVGGLSHQFETIFRRIFMPHLLADKAKGYGIKPSKGLLLYGPPGTGKTASARALASLLKVEQSAVFVINGPELLNKFIGQSEENVRNLFAPAKKNPGKLHVFIFDEFDALARKRGGSNNQHNDGVLNQLLTMIDGFTALTNIIVIGITNRKDILDEAVLRPGRFDVHLYIGLPDQKGREEIFKIHAKELIEEQHLDTAIIHGLTKRMANFSGAEIESVIKNAKTLVLRRHIDINDVEASLDKIPDDLQFTADDFIAAMSEIQPAFGSRYYVVPNSLSRPQAPLYDKITKELLSASLSSELLSSASNHNKNMLIHGSSKVGKTVLAKHILNDFQAEYKYYLGGREVLGDTRDKVDVLRKVFTSDAKAGLIVIDNLEILLSISYNYYDQQVLQTLLLLLNERSHNVLLVATKLPQLQQLAVTDEVDHIFHLTATVVDNDDEPGDASHLLSSVNDDHLLQ